MMTGTAQSDSIAPRHLDTLVVIRVLCVCAAALLLFFGLAGKAGAEPGAAGVTTPVTSAETTAVPFVSSTVRVAYDDASCSTCHYNDIQREHQTRGGCTLCHKNDGYASNTTVLKMPGKKGCGVDNSACHSVKSKSPWHGTDAAKVTAAHAVSIPTVLPTAGSAAVSCAGDGFGAACHANGSTQSAFLFGSMDVASAHADYNHAITNDLTNHDINVTISPLFMSSVDSCGVCHDKASNQPHMLKKAAADLVLPAQKAQNFSCLTCHNSRNTYVAAEVYPDELKALYPGRSLCFVADPKLTAPEAARVALKPLRAPALDSSSTTQTTNSQLGSLLNGLSPDLKAQLSGVVPGKQQQLSAGVLAPENGGIPASALPATSISDLTLFK